jgi:hypothetical protein
MAAANDTVRGRIDGARTELTPTAVAIGVGLAVALGVTLLFLGEPLAHDALHEARHAAGVTCH